MKHFIITAAAYMDAEGFGHHKKGHSPWPEHQVEVPPGTPPKYAWSSMFSSPCHHFGRLDPLSKICLSVVELLGVDFSLAGITEREQTGLVMSTESGTLVADHEFYQGRLNPEGPSPSLFTYTLPNVPLGEIAIRYGLKGPNLCLIQGRDDAGGVLREALRWLRDEEASSCLCLHGDAFDHDLPSVTGLFQGPWGAYAVFIQEESKACQQGLEILWKESEPIRPWREWCEELCAALAQ